MERPKRSVARERQTLKAANAATATKSVTPQRTRRSRPNDSELDAADVRLVELLTENGRLTNRSLALEIGLTEATVAARIRGLFDRRILGVTALLDWRAAGYEWDIWLEINVHGRPVRAVGEALAALDGVHSVHVVFGPVDLLVHLLLPDRAAAVEFLTERISTIPGVRRVKPNVTLETLKYLVKYARVPVRSAALEFPAPTIELDGLDRSIIDELVMDGRQSNREVARQVNVSEGTVRVRLKRLEEAGVLRIAGQSDPYLAGLVGAWAFVGVEVTNGRARQVSSSLLAIPEVQILAITAGHHDLFLYLAASSRTELVDLVGQIRSVDGVLGTETWQVVQTIQFNFQWSRLL